jgi:hypothetical protein
MSKLSQADITKMVEKMQRDQRKNYLKKGYNMISENDREGIRALTEQWIQDEVNYKGFIKIIAKKVNKYLSEEYRFKAFDEHPKLVQKFIE